MLYIHMCVHALLHACMHEYNNYGVVIVVNCYLCYRHAIVLCCYGELFCCTAEYQFPVSPSAQF